MQLAVWQIIVGAIMVIAGADFIRLLLVKLVGKKYRMFALVPDNDNLRLEYVAFKWDAETTEVVHDIENDEYYLVNDPDVRYKVQPITGYKLVKSEEYEALKEKRRKQKAKK